MSDRIRERDLVLSPNEFAFISDETKGNINVYVGPHKTSLANTDQPIVFDHVTKRFARKSLDEATQTFSIAPEGWYLVLKNPAHDATHPRTGALNNLPDLTIGRKVNIPGPVSFALWPGQMVKVIQGHQLRSNQYLLVRVYDEEGARNNWRNAVIKPQKGDENQTDSTKSKEPEEEKDGAIVDPNHIPTELSMGKVMLIRGTDVSFYIPPTGIEIVQDHHGNYIREAATLERLEYCILLDENGNKRYIQGPAVVFPKPTEAFVTKGGSRKFRAIELNENSGIYLKIIAPFEENGVDYKVGDELFLTGRDQMIYFPRPEHAIIRYGEHEIHYGVAIPAGEARYVLDRNTGHISLKRGPFIFLPDPRKEVIVRRVLDNKTVSLWFPGNEKALLYNQELQKAQDKQDDTGQWVTENEVQQKVKGKRGKVPEQAMQQAVVPSEFAGDDFTRGQQFTPPRTIVLDNRYEGAVAVSAWTGYAVLVVNKNGERKVIRGPQTNLLEYDEILQVMELSTGTPKTDERLLKTVYLRVLNNNVSDIVEAETTDLCKVHLHLSYRVNFEGDPATWFDVENYVKFLTDHLRSLLRHAIKQHGIEDFYANAVTIMRDVILGPIEEGKRKGRLFPENGMRVYDVEVLNVTIGDEAISSLLIDNQHAVVSQTLASAAEQRKLEFCKSSELIQQQMAEVQSQTRQRSQTLKIQEMGKILECNIAEIQAENQLRELKTKATLANQQTLTAIHQAELARTQADKDAQVEFASKQLELTLRQLQAEVQAVAEKAKAVSPDLIAAMQAFGDRALAEKMAQTMAPLAILGGESVSEVLARLLRGTPLARLLEQQNASSSGE
jgi:major vault protein